MAGPGLVELTITTRHEDWQALCLYTAWQQRGRLPLVQTTIGGVERTLTPLLLVHFALNQPLGAGQCNSRFRSRVRYPSHQRSPDHD